MKRCQGVTTQLEQRINILFCVRLGWNFTQIQTSLRQVYGDWILSKSSIYHWICEFKQGRTQMVDKPRSPRPRTGRCRANIWQVENMVAQDRRISLAQMSVQSGIKATTIFRILTLDLKLVKKCAKFVPHFLQDHERLRRERVCNFMCCLKSNCPRIFRHVITMDEAWMYVYDPELKVHSREWMRQDEPRPQKPRREMSTAKVMLVAFFDTQGMVYYEFLQRPLTMNQHVFQAIFRHFDTACRVRRPRATVRGRQWLHMDNASPHTATNTLTLMDNLGWSRLPQPSYSPDLVPCDFWLFHRIKKNLRGCRFQNLAVLKDTVAEEIAQIPSQDYSRAILESWPKRWRCCLADQGNYFEGHS